MSDTCSQFRCDDAADETIYTADGGEYPVCEDHKYMRVDGTPAEGYEPNDPSKFSNEPDPELREAAAEEFNA
jgi:hypothetical protein